MEGHWKRSTSLSVNFWGSPHTKFLSAFFQKFSFPLREREWLGWARKLRLEEMQNKTCKTEKKCSTYCIYIDQLTLPAAAIHTEKANPQTSSSKHSQTNQSIPLFVPSPLTTHSSHSSNLLHWKRNQTLS